MMIVASCVDLRILSGRNSLRGGNLIETLSVSNGSPVGRAIFNCSSVIGSYCNASVPFTGTSSWRFWNVHRARRFAGIFCELFWGISSVVVRVAQVARTSRQRHALYLHLTVKDISEKRGMRRGNQFWEHILTSKRSFEEKLKWVSKIDPNPLFQSIFGDHLQTEMNKLIDVGLMAQIGLPIQGS